MIDAANYNRTVNLKNGTQVKVRSIRPDDKPRLLTAFKNLDPESIYTRFFYHKKVLTSAELKAATEIDFESVVALVVTTGEVDQETIIGAGRYAVIDESGHRAPRKWRSRWRKTIIARGSPASCCSTWRPLPGRRACPASWRKFSRRIEACSLFFPRAGCPWRPSMAERPCM